MERKETNKLIKIEGKSPCPIEAILLKHIKDDTWLALSTKGKKIKVFQCNDGWGEVKETAPTVLYYFKGLYHRDNDLPAVIDPSGIKVWYQHGEFRRDKNPFCWVLQTREKGE